MAKVVAFSNQKGGVGKTTTCVNLAAYLALDGYKILLVDFDAQANATSSLGIFDKKIQNSVYDAMCGYDVSKCIFKSEIDGLDFIPSSLDLCALDKELVGVQRKEYVLKDALDKVKSDYDFVFIDCAPSINMLLVNALCAADGVIIPLQCEYLALEGMNQLLNTVRLAKRHLNDSLTVYGVVLTMYTGRSKLSRDVESEIKKLFGREVFETKIPRNVRLAEAPSNGKPIALYDDKCAGAIAYNALANEFISKFIKE